MEVQSEVWILLHEDEYRQVWDRVYNELSFCPSVNSIKPPFILNCPYDIYDISDLPLDDDSCYKSMEQTIIAAFISCMENDDFMYALDWQHSGFRYNPRITTPKENSFVEDNRYNGGGYNAYFPGFYPDGDYYFFIAKDFRWGYLSHPWLQKIWVFGDNLMERFRDNYKEMSFKLCT